MVTKKKIKEYGNKTKRLRIDINKSDGFAPDSEVVILSASEFDKYCQMESDLIAKDKELEILRNQEQNLKEIIENITSPIYEKHKKELRNKEIELKQLQTQLDLLNSRCNQYNLDLQGLNLIDILILRKHKKLIQSFNSDVANLSDDHKIVDAKLIPEDDLKE